ncbi:hypothetical protein MJ1HA_2449 [Metallosphaera sedula]|nr:hypothetical protein MJ1HA_2449 [Metallosphaera sedula]
MLDLLHEEEYRSCPPGASLVFEGCLPSDSRRHPDVSTLN